MSSEPAASVSPPLISVVIPTRNERVTIVPLARSILGALDCTPSEVIVVDDNSPDGTAEEVAAFASTEPRVRLLSRDGKHGLASAVFHAAHAARGRFACILDADFSHDPAEIPGMLAKAQEGYDVVIGSRFVPGAANIGQPPPRRLASTISERERPHGVAGASPRRAHRLRVVQHRLAARDADALFGSRLQVAPGTPRDDSRSADRRVAHRVPGPPRGQVQGRAPSASSRSSPRS